MIIHHHLFKNAGTAIDSVAQANERIDVLHFEPPGQLLKTEHVDLAHATGKIPWLSSHAYISRDFLAPTRSVRIAVIRHPIDRVGSVYRFERRQGLAGSGGLSARMASSKTFPDWTRWHLDRTKTGVIQNFHVSFLVGKKIKSSMGLTELSMAKMMADSEISTGVFELLSVSGQRWGDEIESEFGVRLDFDSMKKENWTSEDPSLESRLETIQKQLGKEIFGQILESNLLDLDLHKYVSSKLR